MSEEKMEVLACPFCGGQASGTGKVRYGDGFAKEQGWSQSTFYYCNCMICCASNQGLRGYDTAAEAIAAWNRRSAADDETIRLQDEYIAKLANGPAADEIERLRRSPPSPSEIRREALEEAAKVCDTMFPDPYCQQYLKNGARSCAAAIRSLIGKKPDLGSPQAGLGGLGETPSDALAVATKYVEEEYASMFGKRCSTEQARRLVGVALQGIEDHADWKETT